MFWFHFLLLVALLGAQTGKAADFDLSAWDPDRDGSASLNGDWDMYWGRLWTPEDFKESRVKTPPSAFAIPGLWNTATLGTTKLRANGYATYRGRMFLSEDLVKNQKALTMEIPNAPGAYKLWLNGKLAITFGIVGKNRSQEKASIGMEFFTFVPDKTEIEIVLQMSSFHHRDGGTWWPIRVGAADQVTKIRAASLGLDGFTLSCVFIMAFYHFGLFLMRPQYKAPLMFAIFCTVISIRASVTGLGDIHKLVFPDMPQGLQKIMEYAGFYLGVPAFYGFVRELFPDEIPKRVSQFFWLVGGGFALSTLILPVYVFTKYIEFFQVFTVGAILTFCTQFTLSLIRKRDGAFLLLIGSAILMFSSINDILHAHRIGIIPSMVFPYGLFFMILCQSMLLARRFSRAFQAVEVNETQIQALNAELQNQNLVLDQLVDDKTRDIRSIMQNIKQGIFTIMHEDARIGPEFSDHLRTLVEAPDLQAGQSYKRIFEKSQMTADRRNQIQTVLSNVVGQDSIGFDVNAHLLPQEMQMQSQGGPVRSMEVDWNPIENEHTGMVEKVLVSLRDVTDLRRLQEEAQHNQVELQLIGEVLNVPLDKFEGVLHSCQKFVDDCLEHMQTAAADANRFFRNMHTVKGVARSYGLSHLADAAHLCEEDFALLRDGKKITREQLQESTEQVAQMIKRYEFLSQHKLGRKSQDSHMLMIDRSVLAENLDSLLHMDRTHFDRETQLRLTKISQFFMNLVYTPLSKILKDHLRDIPDLARELGKEPPEILILDPGISIKPDAFDLFRNVFTHLLRNSLDHGLETPQERLKQGKSTRGRIVIEMKWDAGALDIFVSDDGRGLNLQAIRAKAQQRGLIAKAQQLSDYEIANQIFAPGLTTKEQVTAVSGRGVGLDAVKNFIEHFNGAIEIVLTAKKAEKGREAEGRPFGFHITLPSPMCEPMQVIPGPNLPAAS